MTEADWLACGGKDWVEAGREVSLVEQRGSKRKLRLFSCACCRLIWPLLKDASSREAVEASERYADRQLARRELGSFRDAARQAVRNSGETPGEFAAYSTTASKCNTAWVAKLAQNAAVGQGGEWHPHAIAVAQRKLLRCIFGNPFRAVTTDSSWLTTTVQSLAAAIYAERAFDRMPVLGDALEDIGCANQDVLHHCRSGGEHFRGCWVVDLILGRQ